MEDSAPLVYKLMETYGLVNDGWELYAGESNGRPLYELWHGGLRYFSSTLVVETRAFIIGIWTQKSFFSSEEVAS